MGMYLLLFVLLTAAWVLSFILSGKELLSPASVATASLAVAGLLALLGYGSWNTIQLTIPTVFILFICSLSVTGGATLAQVLWKRRGPTGNDKNQATAVKASSISYDVSTWKYIVLVIIMLFILVEHIFEIFRIARQSGQPFSGYTDAVRIVRESTSTVFSTENVSFSAGLSILGRFLDKIAPAVGYLSVVLIVHAIVMTKDWRRIIPPTLVYLTYCVYALASGGRAGVFLSFLAAVVASYFFIIQRYKLSPLRLSFYYLAGIGGLAVIGGVLFYAMGSLVGRKAVGSPFEYITFYFGCGIPSFQYILEGGFPTFNLPGFNVFHEFYYLLLKLKIVSDVPAYGSNFVWLGSYGSNVYTGAYRYYADFGVIGVVLGSSLMGFLFMIFYQYVKQRDARSALVAIYCMIAALLFDFARDEKLFANVLNANIIMRSVIICVIVYWLLAPRGKFKQIWLRINKTETPLHAERNSSISYHHRVQPTHRKPLHLGSGTPDTEELKAQGD